MATAPAFTKTGAKSQTPASLDARLFGETPNHDLIGLAYRAYLANGRHANAKVATRGEVRGGGKKPWRQKGTGRARAGGTRLPHWRGGGKAFGPTGEENYSITLPVKVKRAAIRQALSLQAHSKKVVIIEDFAPTEGKVRSAMAILQKLDAKGTVLIVLANKDALVDRATRNIPAVKVVAANYLNVFDILNADFIVISQPSLVLIHSWLIDKAKTGASVSATKPNKAKATPVKDGPTAKLGDAK